MSVNTFNLNLNLNPLSGYEVEGLENIPAGPAMICFYHGAIPIDHYYLLSVVLTKSGRLIKTVGDRFLYRIPGQQRERQGQERERQAQDVRVGCEVSVQDGRSFCFMGFLVVGLSWSYLLLVIYRT